VTHDVAYDAICIGRVGIDLYPERVGRPLAEQDRFSRSLGGSPTNVAVGVARLGRRVALVSGVGEDGFGDYAIQALEGYGVATTWVARRKGVRTPVVFAEVFPPDRFPLLFYRETPAPDELIGATDLDRDAIMKAKRLWVTGGSLAVEQARETVLLALSWRENRGTIFDLDWRPSQWADVSDPVSVYARALEMAEVVIGNEDEFRRATGREDLRDAVAAISDIGPRIVVLKQGPRGVSARARGGNWVFVPAIPTEVVCGLGAGDAFGAAFAHGHIAEWPLERCISYANVAGAIVASRLHCAEAMPRHDEIESVLSDQSMLARLDSVRITTPTNSGA